MPATSCRRIDGIRSAIRSLIAARLALASGASFAGPSSPWPGKGAACRSGTTRFSIREGAMGANEGEGGIFQQVGSMFSSLFGGKLSTGQRLEVEVMFGLIGYLA